MADNNNNNINNDDGDEVFVYMGEGMVVPDDVVRVRVHPSVTVIPDNAFCDQGKLKEIELCEGLLEIIGSYAFANCWSLTRIELPSNLKRIGERAFNSTPLVALQLPDGLESIGDFAFAACNILKLRIPPLVTTIPRFLMASCKGLVSMELSENVTRIESASLSCRSMRNLAIPPNAEMEDYIFCISTDLLQIFNHSDTQITYALKQRFDNLPIHKMIYYQSYNNLTLNQLETAVDMRSGQRRSLRRKLDPTGNQQDCLGMTPLHILACSTVQDLSLYQTLIEKYPNNLITEDRWGAVPLVYAMWGNAPNEIVEFLVQSYQSIYPNYELNWSKMVEELTLADVPECIIQNILAVQRDSFPEQSINWNRVLDQLANFRCLGDENTRLPDLFRFLVKYSSTARINAIGLKALRDDINHTIRTLLCPIFDTKTDFLAKIQVKLADCEAEYQRLKEATTILELALWKKKMNESNDKKRSMDEKMSFRDRCRISCDADIIIENVLPYLMPNAKVSEWPASQEQADDGDYPSSPDLDGGESYQSDY